MKNKTSVNFILCVISAAMLFLAGCGSEEQPVEVQTQPEPLEEITEVGEMHYACSFDGVKHDFIIDLPDTVELAPLAVVLPEEWINGFDANTVILEFFESIS